jgi:hypothetical protein
MVKGVRNIQLGVARHGGRGHQREQHGNVASDCSHVVGFGGARAFPESRHTVEREHRKRDTRTSLTPNVNSARTMGVMR